MKALPLKGRKEGRSKFWMVEIRKWMFQAEEIAYKDLEQARIWHILIKATWYVGCAVEYDACRLT